MTMINEAIARTDRANMFTLIREFPAQVAEALEIGAKATVPPRR